MFFLNTLVVADSTTTTKGTIEFIAGDLSIDSQSLPSNLDFGTHPIQFYNNEVWTAQTNGTDTSAVISVEDYRGNPTGWSLKVKQTQDWISVVNSSDKLTGATLDAYVDVDNISNVGGTLPTGQNGIDNKVFRFGSINEDKIIMSAKSNEGSGITSMTISKYDLNVPASSEKRVAEYGSTFVWTLSDTPGL